MVLILLPIPLAAHAHTDIQSVLLPCSSDSAAWFHMHEYESPTVLPELADILDSILGILGQRSREISKAD